MRAAFAVLALCAALPVGGQDVPNVSNADPNDWESYYRVGVELLLRQPRRSVRFFEHAARLDPMAAEPWLGLVAAFWRDRQNLARRRAEGDPLLGRMREVQEAEARFHRAFVLNPFAPLGLLTYTLPQGYRYDDRNPLARGTAAFLQNDFRRARDELDRAISESGDDIEAHHWRGMARVHLGDYAGAVADLESVLRGVERVREAYTIYGPTNATDLYYMLALLAARVNDWQRALPAFERALTDDVTNAWAHLHFGNLLMRRDTTHAIAEYAAAVELLPDEPAIVASYGTGLLGAGRYEEALVQLDRAIALNPWWARPYYNRAVCLDLMGRTDDAYAAWGDYLARSAIRETAQRTRAQERRAALQP